MYVHQIIKLVQESWAILWFSGATALKSDRILDTPAALSSICEWNGELRF